MKRILLLVCVMLSVSCNESNSTQIKSNKKIESTSKKNLKSDNEKTPVDTLKIIDIGYSDTYEKLPKLTFEPSTEKEFLAIKENEFFQALTPRQDNNFFYIQTATKKHTFKKYRDYGGTESWSGFEYLGYYPETKLFAIQENSTADNLGFGALYLLDSLNDYRYNIISFGDGAIELPIPSLHNTYFVYFYNSTYEHKNCDIGILKINDRSNSKKYLSEHASYNSQNFAVEKIVWKTDSSFYVKGYEEIYTDEKWVKKYNYYKTEIK